LTKRFQRRRCFISTNQQQELPVAAVFVNGSTRYDHFFTGLSIDGSYQVAILASDWSISKKYFPLKPLGQMSRIFVGNSYGRPSIKIAHFILIR
jgi:hypothetical protein